MADKDIDIMNITELKEKTDNCHPTKERLKNKIYRLGVIRTVDENLGQISHKKY